jgi:hypothetical protein
LSAFHDKEPDVLDVLFPVDHRSISVIEIRDHGFSFCPHLKAVTGCVPPSLRTICGFDDTSLGRVQIPSSVRTLDAFSDCPLSAEVLFLDDNPEPLPLVASDGMSRVSSNNPKRRPEGRSLHEIRFAASPPVTVITALLRDRLSRLEPPRSVEAVTGINRCLLLSEILFHPNGALRQINGFLDGHALSFIVVPSSVEVLHGFSRRPRLATVVFACPASLIVIGYPTPEKDLRRRWFWVPCLDALHLRARRFHRWSELSMASVTALLSSR